jgi:hypothetical protein
MARARAKESAKVAGLNVQEVAIGDVVPYDRNPRKNVKAVDKVAASLREYGWQQPIVVDAAMVIVAGHTRYLAAKSLGMSTVPVHIASTLTPEQVRAYRIADNRTHEEADWDLDLLRSELSDLDVGALVTGFDAAEIERIASGAQRIYEPNVTPEITIKTHTNADIAATQNRLDSQFEDAAKARSERSIMCPSCATQFYIDE